mgnify:CR=1 FL=1
MTASAEAKGTRDPGFDAGRLADSSPLWAAFVSYPAYRSKTKSVTTFQQRLQGCFEYSMNGRAPPLGAPELVAHLRGEMGLAQAVTADLDGGPELLVEGAGASVRRSSNSHIVAANSDTVWRTAG